MQRPLERQRVVASPRRVVQYRRVPRDEQKSEAIVVRQPKRAAVSAFQAPTFSVPSPLGDCWLIKKILAAPCNVRLIQKRYGEFSTQHRETEMATYTITYRDKTNANVVRGTLSYCILNSIMSHLVRRNSKLACVAGSITLLIYGSPKSREQHIIESASIFQLDFPEWCKAKQTIYVPLNAWWSSRSTITGATELDPCAGQCDSGHAMALIIDNKERTIEYFEPNGKNARWYATIALFLTQWFKKNPQFKDYRVDEEFCCPPVGIQMEAGGLPMCAYFSSLYVAIRLLCQDSIPENEVVSRILQLGKHGIRQLLQRWHCFLLQYDDRHQITGTALALRKLYSKTLGKLAELSLHRQYRTRLAEIESIAFNDVRLAFSALYPLYEELKQKKQEFNQQQRR